MADEKKIVKKDEETKKQGLDLEDLEQVTGGSIKNVKYTGTSDISSDTKSKI